MTKQRLGISQIMRKSAEEMPAQPAMESIMRAIIDEIKIAGIPFSKLTLLSPTETSRRLKCEMPENYDGIKKTIVAVHLDGSTVNVRRDIDPGQDTAFPFNSVDIKGLSPKDAAARVVDEICRLHDRPMPRRQVIQGPIPVRQ